jgi:hypothetical protein
VKVSSGPVLPRARTAGWPGPRHQTDTRPAPVPGELAPAAPHPLAGRIGRRRRRGLSTGLRRESRPGARCVPEDTQQRDYPPVRAKIVVPHPGPRPGRSSRQRRTLPVSEKSGRRPAPLGQGCVPRDTKPPTNHEQRCQRQPILAPDLRICLPDATSHPVIGFKSPSNTNAEATQSGAYGDSADRVSCCNSLCRPADRFPARAACTVCASLLALDADS